MAVFLLRSKTIYCLIILFPPILFLLHPWTAFSEETLEDALKPDEELDEELKYLREETYVITPSKIPQRIEKAPGTIYVVTDRQIRQMGARYLIDVAKTVPGWYVWETYWGYPLFFVRGDAGWDGNRVSFMVNSHVVNDVYDGTANKLYGFLDLDNVKRIEFVSGPASALYGSGAMSGIINIITKEGEDVDGLQLTGRGGSFNTWEGNALFGKTFHDLEVAAYANYRTTDGFRGHVERDQQSVLDEQYGTHASLAPGNMKGDAYQLDAQLTMKYKGLKFDGKFIDWKGDMPFSWRPILDNMSNVQRQQYYLNLSYDATITEGLDLMAKVYRNQNSDNGLSQYCPKGSWFRTPAGPMITSENRFVEYEGKNSRTGAEAQAIYEIVDSNTIVGGITFEEQRVYDNTGKANFMPTSDPNVNTPLPSVQDWPDQYVFPTKKRNVWAVYVEDLWDIMEDLRLTIGGRYDHYSDFGGEISPRVGINWAFARNFNTKFLYGRAFRAPSFDELYHRTTGNPNLKPETEDSYELSLGAEFFPFTGQVTVFYKNIKDNIGYILTKDSPPRRKNANLSEMTNQGVTLQMKYDFGRGTYIGMNYTHLSMAAIMGPEAQRPGKRWTDAYWYEPARMGTLMANVRLNRYLNLNTYLLYRGGWGRGGLYVKRDDPGDYVTANVGLIAKNFLKELKGLEIRGMVYNLLNKQYTSPTSPTELPDDMPMPGINFFLELRYTF